jgi:hypothetical protein
MKLLGIISVGFGTTDQALMRFSAFGSTGEKIGGQ